MEIHQQTLFEVEVELEKIVDENVKVLKHRTEIVSAYSVGHCIQKVVALYALKYNQISIKKVRYLDEASDKKETLGDLEK